MTVGGSGVGLVAGVGVEVAVPAPASGVLVGLPGSGVLATSGQV